MPKPRCPGMPCSLASKFRAKRLVFPTLPDPLQTVSAVERRGCAMDGRISVTPAKGVRAWCYCAVLLPLVVGLAVMATAHLRRDALLHEEIIRLRADSSRAEANEQELQRLQERVRSHDADAERLGALAAELERVRGRLKETDAARAAASDAASNRASAIQTENTWLYAQLNDVTSRVEALNRRLNDLKAENRQLKADFGGKPRVPKVGAWIGVNIGEAGENNPAAQGRNSAGGRAQPRRGGRPQGWGHRVQCQWSADLGHAGVQECSGSTGGRPGVPHRGGTEGRPGHCSGFGGGLASVSAMGERHATIPCTTWPYTSVSR